VATVRQVVNTAPNPESVGVLSVNKESIAPSPLNKRGGTRVFSKSTPTPLIKGDARGI